MRHPPCSISADGNHVIPCKRLAENTEDGNPKKGKRGLFAWRYFDRETDAASFTAFGVVTSERPTGMLFNFCPWCGTEIHVPFQKRDQEAMPATEAEAPA